MLYLFVICESKFLVISIMQAECSKIKYGLNDLTYINRFWQTLDIIY